MKITVATGPLFPVPAILGGAIPRLWQGLAEEFVRLGEDVCVVARAHPGQPRTEEIRGVRYLRVGGFDQSRSIVMDLARDFLDAARVVRHLPQGDIVVINDFWLPVFCGFFRRGAGRIVINANRFPKGQYWLYRRASRIAAASTSVRDAIVGQCPELAERTRVYPNPVDSVFLDTAESEQRSSRRKEVLYVGRMHPEKGVHVLVEAFSRVAAGNPGWSLRLVGPHAESQGGGGEAFLRELVRMAAGHDVRFEGPVFDRASLAALYRAACLFCYPSLAEQGEAFGLAPLEAMACGVAPLVSRLSCFDDFIEDGRTGWRFDHRAADPAGSLAGVLARLMIDEAGLERTGRLAHESATRFSYGAVARRYLDDFRSLVGNEGTR